MNDNQIIVKTAEAREQLFIKLYKDLFPAVARYVSKRGGTFDEAKDIFQDALVIWYEKSAKSEVINEKAYLMGIAKHLWLKNQSLHNPNVVICGFDKAIDEESQPSK